MSFGLLTKHRFFTVCIALTIGVFAALSLNFFLNSEIASARNDSFRRLSEAVDAAAMDEAVGGLGIVFHLADGSWIAVRYVDRHHGDSWSCEVAVDGAGRWYESEEHFCGQFKIYRGEWDKTLEVLRNPQVTQEEKKWWLANCPLRPASLSDVEDSPDLESAREKLQAIGFRESTYQPTPKVTGPWPVLVTTKASAVKQLLD